jgi:hypothetical protein
MKALEKDRTRRYGSPRDLADDIRRFLRNEPVLAGPPSWAYWTRKFVRRHRRELALAVLSIAAAFAIAFATVSANDRRLARHRQEEVSVLAAARLGNKLASDQAVALGRLEARIAAGHGSEADHARFVESLSKLKWSGRAMQDFRRPRVRLGIRGRMVSGLQGNLGIMVKNVSLFVDGNPTSVDVEQPRVIRLMPRSSSGVGYGPELPETVGAYTLRGTVTACLVLIPGYVGAHYWDSEFARELGALLHCKSADTILQVPPFALTLVSELPEAYPLPIDDAILLKGFVKQIRFDTVELSQRETSTYRASVGVTIPPPANPHARLPCALGPESA